MMNFIKSIRAIGLLASGTQGFAQDTSHSHPSAIKTDTVKKKSIAQQEHAQKGATHITTLYTAPAVRGRISWEKIKINFQLKLNAT